MSEAPGAVFPQTLDASDALVGVETQKTATDTYVAHVVRWDGSGFTELGALPTSPACGSTKASGARVARGPDGRLVAALSECDGTWAASFDGEWHLLGVALTGVDFPPGFGIDPLGRPVVVWTDGARPPAFRVSIGTATAWQQIGAPLPGEVLSTSVAFTSSEMVIASIVFPATYGGFWPVSVSAWDGHAWGILGCPLPSDGEKMASAVVDAAQGPIIARVAAGAVWVDRWDGAQWVELGRSFPSLGGNSHPGLAIDPRGRVVLTYTSTSESQCAAHALRLSAGAWEDLGWSPSQPRNQASGCPSTLVMGSDGVPRVFAADLGYYAIR